MAEFLFRGIDNGTTPGKWRRGDLVTVQEDGHAWGTREVAPDFYLVKVPGVSVARAVRFLTNWADAGGLLGDRSLWRVVIADIPVDIRNTLLTQGYITIGVDCTRAQAEAVIRRKDTDATSDLTP